MELPFYLMSQESPGKAWEGTISLQGEELHIALQRAGEKDGSEFDIPLQAVRHAEFQRGLVCRKLKLLVASEELRRHFPAGVSGEEIELLVARDDAVFGMGEGREAEFERLAGTIAERADAASIRSAPGLVS